MKAKRVILLGELLLRLDTGHERFVQAGSFKAYFTGAEANAGASLANWGYDVFAVSRVPDHEIGQACVNYLRRFGINTGYVQRAGERIGVFYVETGASQRKSKVIYDRSHSAFTTPSRLHQPYRKRQQKLTGIIEGQADEPIEKLVL